MTTYNRKHCKHVVLCGWARLHPIFLEEATALNWWMYFLRKIWQGQKMVLTSGWSPALVQETCNVHCSLGQQQSLETDAVTKGTCMRNILACFYICSIMWPTYAFINFVSEVVISSIIFFSAIGWIIFLTRPVFSCFSFLSIINLWIWGHSFFLLIVFPEG